MKKDKRITQLYLRLPRKEYQQKFQREWLRKRKVKWFQDNGPCKHCGSWDKLELDHIDPSTKIAHKIWSWSEERRLKELSKCQALCESCHQLKSSQECRDRTLGKVNYECGKYNKETVDLAFSLYVLKKYSRRNVAYIMGLHPGTISRWIYGPRFGEWLKRQALDC